MALNGSGIRDTARVLRISPTIVIAVLKKTAAPQHANPTLLHPLRSRAGTARVLPLRAAELNEMGVLSGPKQLQGDVYRRQLPPAQHSLGKLSMQKIERNL
jgi:hypothetical protein